jgi:hypothetical protein
MDDGGIPISGYEVEVKASGVGSAFTRVRMFNSQNGGATPNSTVCSLLVATPYIVRVRAASYGYTADLALWLPAHGMATMPVSFPCAGAATFELWLFLDFSTAVNATIFTLDDGGGGNQLRLSFVAASGQLVRVTFLKHGVHYTHPT